MNVEEMEAFAAEHGISALLDHLGLDELGNRIIALERENRWLRGIIFDHVGTDPENVDPDGPPTPEQEAEQRAFYERVEERRRRMFGDSR